MKSLFTSTVLVLALAAGTALTLGAPARAQRLGPHSDGPIDITADELEVQNKACISIWRGKAEALQGTARVRADVMKAFMEPKPGKAGATGTGACGDLIRIEADGSVYYLTDKDQRARGDHGVYEASSDTVTLTGDVVAVQGQNVLRGTRMVFNTQTGEGHLTGNAAGRNTAERPRGVFYPSKKKDQAQQQQPSGAQ
ncbi:MAG: organic solvent tolerance protein OstA [Caulobacterales bacterium]|nr:organic solvent tolerance protein OstA [Caulobacterales bacterium]